MSRPLVKKYLSNKLKVLAKIDKLSKTHGFTYFSEIELTKQINFKMKIKIESLIYYIIEFYLT
jgi:hypothetical protein